MRNIQSVNGEKNVESGGESWDGAAKVGGAYFKVSGQDATAVQHAQQKRAQNAKNRHARKKEADAAARPKA